MARKKAVKKYTLAEFKAWLEGIEEIQPADWHPDLDQWKMIREKIGAIVEPPPVVKGPNLPPAGMQHEPRPGYQPVASNQPVRRPPVQQPSALDEVSTTPGQLNPVTPAGGMTPAAKAAMSGKLPKGDATPAGGLPTGTPSSSTPIPNTEDGSYASTFT